MQVRSTLLIAFACCFTGTAFAQTVRLETSLGDIDIRLLPGVAPINVQNFLNYVTSGRYDDTVINRAQGNFVVQAGSFSSSSTAPPADGSGFTNVVTDASVQGEPASTTGQSNVRGTVALALPGLPGGGTNQNGGTSSFFINGGSNTFLDTDFTVFGVVDDLTTVDTIFAAPDLADGNSRYGGGLAFSDIPLQSNGDLVFINSATVIPEPSTAILALVGVAVPFLVRRRNAG